MPRQGAAMSKGAPTVVETKELFGWSLPTPVCPPLFPQTVFRRGKPDMIKACNKKPITDNTLLIIVVE